MLVSRWFAAVCAVALCAGLMGCGSSEGDDEGEATMGGSPTLQIYFPKLYTAVIPGSDKLFQVPAVVAGVKPDEWKCSDPSAVTFAEDQIDNGVMITAKKPGKFTITAISGKMYGEAEIEITAATQAELDAGQARYENQVMLMIDRSLINPMTMQDVATNNASCKNCHGSGANFLAVEHTPQQTGGYSDAQLRDIFSMGKKPEGAPYGTFPGIAMFYPSFHRWAGTEEEYKGLIVYLRSLMPKAQGDLDFMGLINQFRMRRGMMGAAGAPPADAPPAGAAGAPAP